MRFTVIFVVTFFVFFACGKTYKGITKNESGIISDNQTNGNNIKSNTVLIETEFGNMKIRLYDETPKHKENFIKLVSEGYFNGTLFHRVINSFMIQGGDPDSKDAEPGILLGNGGPDYSIPAEFRDSLFHKKGVIAAAREGDFVNPKKASSGSQFYIVQGVKFSDADILKVETRQSVGKYIDRHTEYREIVYNLQMKNDREGYNQLIEEIKNKEDFKIYHMPDFKRKIYKEIGGTPHLDNNYTVFGEVIEGIEVIDKIAAAETDQNDRPLTDIIMNIKVIKE